MRAFHRINREIHLEEDYNSDGLRDDSLDDIEVYEDDEANEDFHYFRHNYRFITPP